MIEAVFQWEIRRISEQACPLCGENFVPELVEMAGYTQVEYDPLPWKAFYNVVCPSVDCQFEARIVVMSERGLDERSHLIQAIQAHAWYIDECGLQCQNCGTKVCTFHLGEYDVGSGWFELTAYCPCCENSLEYDFGWKVLRIPEDLDPARRARKKLQQIYHVSELLDLMGIKGS